MAKKLIIEPEQAADNAMLLYALWTVVLGLGVWAVLTILHYYYLQRQPIKQSSSHDDEGDDYRKIIASEPTDLAFSGISLTLSGKKKKEPRVLLDNISGSAKAGRLLAIMGPSGAGKSSLLHAIMGKIKYSSQLELKGTRQLNGQDVAGHSMMPSATLIEQTVSFFPHMTVRETLSFRVELKLGSSRLSKSARDQMVEDVLQQVGLTKAADTIVGNDKVRGISGGERKRLSIAVELISTPSSVIMLDEPTSGLDATAATKFMTTLRQMAVEGNKTIVAVIHQPSQHVFAMFDDLLLINEGKLMYMGPVSKVREHMNKYGCQADSEIGTAEHVLDCISRVPISPDESDSEMDKRLESIANHAQQEGAESKKSQSSEQVAVTIQKGPQASVVKQFGILMKRSVNEVLRGKKTLIIKMVQQVTIGVIYGGIYSLGTDQASIQDRFGLLSLIAIGSANTAVAQTIRSFPKEKAIISNEIASKMYRTLPYFVGKALSELPLIAVFNGVFGTIVYHMTGLSDAPGKFLRFLMIMTTHGMASEAVGLLVGAVSPNSDVALAMLPAVFVLNIIFDGKNISEESIPWLLKWIPKVGLIRWGFEGLCMNEFEGLEFEASGPRRGPVAKVGADALARFGLGNKSIQQILKAQLAITLGSWALSFVGLTLTGQKWQVMKSQ